MTIFTRQLINCVFGFFLLGLLPLGARAQSITQGADSVTSIDRGCVTILCGTVADPKQAVDGDPNTAASISPALALSSAGIRVRFKQLVPAGATVRVILGFRAKVLNLDLVNQTALNIFSGSGSTGQQTFGLNNLLSLTALNNNKMTVQFTTNKAIKELELRTGSVLSVNLAYTVDLYHVEATYPTPLPVALVAFTGKASGTAVSLSWRTASEQNSSHFVVERAVGEPTNFRPLGRIASAGNSLRANDYSFVDAQPAALNYYRLQQVDQDGTTTYSPVVVVQATPTLTLQAYPNPTNSTLHVSGAAGTRFTLRNQLGQPVRSGELTDSQQQDLDLQALPDGLYFLQHSAAGPALRVLKAAGVQ